MAQHSDLDLCSMLTTHKVLPGTANVFAQLDCQMEAHVSNSNVLINV